MASSNLIPFGAAALLTFTLAACTDHSAPKVQPTANETDNAAVMYDTLLLNGTIVDGSGATRYQADVALLDGRIADIGELDDRPATLKVDISGLALAPGFIDTHNHSDGALQNSETAAITGFLKQGVTTAVYGVDGHISLDKIRNYTKLASEGGVGINFMSYIGHNAVRRQVMGVENRAPTANEMTSMKSIVKEAMEFGTAGLSTGLMYLPGNFATTEEIIELAKVTASWGAVYDSHVRDPAKNLLASHQECLDIALGAGVDAHPGHIKAVSGVNFGKGPDVVKLIEAGIARGQNVTVDLYPYDGAATAQILFLLILANDDKGRALLDRVASTRSSRDANDAEYRQLVSDIQHYWRDINQNPQVLAQAITNTETPPAGEFSWIKTVGYESMRIVVSSQPGYEGRMVTDLAKEQGISPFELYRRIIVQEGDKAMVTLGAIQEDDVRIIMKQPWAMISSDGSEVNVAHPRSRGTFPRVLGRYVRERNVLTLEQAVHKISGLPARYLKLKDRGIIRKGAVADITVFDPQAVIDKATWNQPDLYSEGITHVLINGEFALKNGQVSKQRYGRFIPFKASSL